ncbi:MAG: class I SAM-dependent RNA methyltransferase [Candidatus Nitrotoga sp.]|nr:class I SAM-dependent RNA methyltransferase [Candidatus Nitrotoga sp.]MBP0116605.1 class I SAM-dependent RNA methyltransferase [Candidatus Nitrotoga sp.]MBP0123105.1 class I SAM-dependent RNA methyltransferase [Candidatus Nitrotoga sp.]MBP0125502.1 class I SAM-dependent RNA methyltransferase [Candidatus Nitrotoga sp.]
MLEFFFSPCPRGLEATLASELNVLGAQEVRVADGGVHFVGAPSFGYLVNLHSRIASRVLWRVAIEGYHSEQDIFDEVYALPWNDWFSVSRTIRVNVTAIKCPLKSLDFITLRIKDAVCDKFRALIGERPSVDTHAPDIRIHAFLEASRMTLYIDTSGDALFKRGTRQYTNIAPLRENLAAGILLLTGWLPGVPLLDPMCGSGTFLIEAALMSLNIAPGIGRNFAFEKFKTFDNVVWREMRNQAYAAQKKVSPLLIFGSDLYGEELKAARLNLENAGLLDSVSLNQANVLEISAPRDHGVLVANLPYGERMGDLLELEDFYPKLGDALKRKFGGWNAYLLTSDLRMPKFIRLSVSRRTPLFNGAIECRLFEYKMVVGGNRG